MDKFAISISSIHNCSIWTIEESTEISFTGLFCIDNEINLSRLLRGVKLVIELLSTFKTTSDSRLESGLMSEILLSWRARISIFVLWYSFCLWLYIKPKSAAKGIIKMNKYQFLRIEFKSQIKSFWFNMLEVLLFFNFNNN